MNKIFAPFLPPWVETGLQPAFYDMESGTVLQQTARMYAKVQQLTRLFNELSEETKTEVENFEHSVNETVENFEHSVNETVAEYIEKFTELKDFVDDYFDNLDVQEEINHKLDAMVEDGTLQELINNYLQPNVAWTFDSVSDMQKSDHLIAGTYAMTYGFYSVGDGGGAKYKIREPEENETANGYTTFAVDELIAELVVDNEVNIKKLGASPDLVDNQAILQYAVTNFPAASVIYIPEGGNYTLLSAIDCSNKAITIKGTANARYNEASATSLVFTQSNGFINAGGTKFRDLAIKGNTSTRTNKGIVGGANVENCIISYFATGIDANYKNLVIKGSYINNCSANGIIDPVDGRIINNTINANDGNGIKFEQGSNDNIIVDNKIEWNNKYGIIIYNAQNNQISNNIIDRSAWGGLMLDGNQSNGNNISNNLLRRNGASDTAGYQFNMKIKNTGDKNIINNNITRTGNSQDDGSGITVPKYGIVIEDCTTTLVYLTDNVFSGGGYTADKSISNSTNVHIIDRTNPIYNNLAIKQSGLLTLNSNDSTTFGIALDSLPADYAVGTSRKVVVNYRTTSDGTFGSKVINAYAYKQYGSYHLDLDNTAIATGVTASGSYTAEDGFLITFTSTSTATFQLKCVEYTC